MVPTVGQEDYLALCPRTRLTTNVADSYTELEHWSMYCSVLRQLCEDEMKSDLTISVER